MAFFSVASIAADEAPVHSLSLRVLVDGSEVMTPNIQVRPNTPAYMSYTEDGATDPKYSLELMVAPDSAIGANVGDMVKATLWKGAFKKSEPVLDSSMILDTAASTTRNAPQSVQVIDSAGTTYKIEVISHGVFMKDPSILLEQNSSCLTKDGNIDLSTKESPSTAPQVQACCGGSCTSKAGQMQCCGAVACCACGYCCSPR